MKMSPEDVSKYEGFYWLSDQDPRGAIYLQTLTDNTQFDYVDLLKNGHLVTDPIPFSLKKGSRWYDLVFAGWPSLFLVSARFRDALKEMKGFQFYPTLIIDSTKKETNDSFVGLAARGRSGPINHDWYTEKVITAGFLPVRKGLYFDLDSWDGSDLFIPENAAFLFVTERVKRIIEQQKLTNVRLERISDLDNYKL
jgi:hypothetical protein